MAGTVGVIAFFVALILVIIVHEAAHFGLAKRFGFKVDEFFVGFGPRIWSTRRGETEYGFKWIPAGGYVRIAGMNPFEEIRAEDASRTYGAKPIWQRALVVAGGPSTHFVLAFLLFAIWLGMVGQPVPERSPLVASVADTLGGVTSPAASAGLEPGDRIVGIDGIDRPTDSQLVRYTRAHVGEPVSLRIRRGDRVLTVEITPVLSTVAGKKVGRIGIVLQTVQGRQTSGALAAITGGSTLVWDSVKNSVLGLGKLFGPEGIGRIGRLLFTNTPRQTSDIQSVVGVSRLVGETAASSRFWDILWILAYVNVFIGLLNLIPLPPFDGGHLAVLAVEKVRRRKVDMRKLIPISAVVATFFVLLFVAVIYLDIAKPINLSP